MVENAACTAVWICAQQPKGTAEPRRTEGWVGEAGGMRLGEGKDIEGEKA